MILDLSLINSLGSGRQTTLHAMSISEVPTELVSTRSYVSNPTLRSSITYQATGSWEVLCIERWAQCCTLLICEFVAL